MINVSRDGKLQEEKIPLPALKKIAKKHGVKPNNLKEIFAPQVGDIIEHNGNKYKVIYVRDDLKFTAEFFGFNQNFKKDVLHGKKDEETKKES